jgi:hypothetical protein
LSAAALVLVLNYLQKHEHPDLYDSYSDTFLRHQADDVLASYPGWSRILGGILKAAGIDGFLGNLADLKEDSAMDASERSEFLAAIHERTSAQHTFEELWTIITQPPRVPLPAELLGLDDTKLKKQLAYWLRSNREVVMDDFVMRRFGTQPRRWQV